jgi:Holliday junction DNA helicase RuvA
MVNAIRGNDIALLTRIPGIGKKTAERMVLELRDKLPVTSAGAGQVTYAGGTIAEDVISALVNLGYQRPVAEKALAGISKSEEPQSFEVMFRGALAVLAR